MAILVFRKQETVTITVPEKKGQFEVVEPEPVVKYDTIYKEGTTKIVAVPNPVNEQLLQEYQSLKDSVSRLEKYKEAITERTYKETFMDSTQQIVVESNVIGTLKSQKVDYTIFPQQIEVKTKRPKYSLYTGLDVQLTPSIQTTPKLTLKTPKMLYNAGYNLNEKAVVVGASIKLF